MLNSNALKIAVIYAVISLLWILFSDRLVLLFVEKENILTRLQTIKGTFFVIATAALIFFLVKREIKRKDNLIKVLDESDQWYKILVRNIPNTDLFLFDTEGAFMQASGPNLAQLGFPPSSFKAKTIKEITLPSRLKKFLILHFNAILKGEEIDQEIVYNKNWYQLRGRPLTDKNGEIYGGIATFTNITNYKNLINELGKKSKEYEALYEEYQTTNEDLKAINEELSQTNKQLAESEERYRGFINQSSEGIYRMDLKEPMPLNLPFNQQVQHIYHKSYLVECNKAFLNMYNFTTSEEPIGKSLADFHDGDNNPENLEILHKFIKNNYQVSNAISNEKTKDGSLRYFSNNTIGIIKNNHLVRFWGTQSDITKRIETLEMLKQERAQAENMKQKYMALFNNMNDAAILHESKAGSNHEAIIIEVNKPFTTLLGYDSIELTGKDISMLQSPEERPITKKFLQEIRQKKFHIRETIIKDKHGKNIDVELSSHLFTYRGQDVILTLIRDIRERKKAREQLDDAYQFTNNVLTNLSEGITVYDQNYRHVLWNKAMEEFTGKTADEVVGKTPFDVFPEYKSGALKKNIDRAMREEHVRSQDYQNPSGKRHNYEWFVSSFSPNYSSSGRVVGVISITTNITRRKKYEEELIKQKERAQESDRLKTSFLANISHEIRTPLNGILGFTELLSNHDLPQESLKYYFAIIKNSSDQLLQIIDDILDISQLENNQLAVNEKPFSINNLLDEIINELRDLLELDKKPINPKADYALSGNNDLIISDRGYLRKIIRHLMHNAEKYTSNGFIEIGYQLIANNMLQFYVSDSGIGIPESKHTIIFKHFRQLNNSQQTNNGGTGLGLAIAKGLTEKLGGTIDVKSRLNEGTTFTVTLPYKPTKKEPPKK